MPEIHGSVWWIELMTRDVPGAVEYYETVCGWTVDTLEVPEGDYIVCSSGGTPVAGIMDMSRMGHMDGVPPYWFSFLAVEDLERALEQTQEAGGVVQREAWSVPGVGRIAIVTDPTGAQIGLITPAETETADDDAPEEND